MNRYLFYQVNSRMKLIDTYFILPLSNHYEKAPVVIQRSFTLRNLTVNCVSFTGFERYESGIFYASDSRRCFRISSDISFSLSYCGVMYRSVRFIEMA